MITMLGLRRSTQKSIVDVMGAFEAKHLHRQALCREIPQCLALSLRKIFELACNWNVIEQPNVQSFIARIVL